MDTTPPAQPTAPPIATSSIEAPATEAGGPEPRTEEEVAADRALISEIAADLDHVEAVLADPSLDDSPAVVADDAGPPEGA